MNNAWAASVRSLPTASSRACANAPIAPIGPSSSTLGHVALVGSGLFSFDTYLGDGPGDGPGSTTLNVGGGARWFKWKHAGFTADMRFYMTKDAGGTTLVAPRGSKRIVVLSVGLSVK